MNEHSKDCYSNIRRYIHTHTHIRTVKDGTYYGAVDENSFADVSVAVVATSATGSCDAKLVLG